MNEIIELCAAIELAKADARPLWLATVVAIEGPSQPRTGARVLFGRDGVVSGTLGAEQLETQLVKDGPAMVRNGPVLRTFTSLVDDDSEVKANATLTVLVERVEAETERCLLLLRELIQRQQRAALVTILESDVPELELGSHLLCCESPRGSARSPSDGVPVAARQLLQQARFVLREGRQRPSHLHCAGLEALVEVVEPLEQVLALGARERALPRHRHH